MNTPGTMTKIGAATHILAGIGAPINQHTVGSMVGWMNAEGGNWGNNAAYNPLNTTLTTPNARAINGAGVKAYSNWGEGIGATVQTLKQPNMAGIVQAFRSGNPQSIAQAIGSSPWGTSASLVHQTISAATGQHFPIPSVDTAGIARGMAQPSSAQTSFGPGTTTTNWGSALADALMSESTGGGSGRVSSRNPLSAAINLVSQNPGKYNVTTPSVSSSLTSGSLRSGTFHQNLGSGDINPLGSGWTLGRSDQGVDANARPGTPIRALNDSKVVDIQHNWYQGQPLVLMQITAGPNAGKYWYVAEQINAPVKIGQTFRKGDVVATYAQQGTGIEIGWGHPGGGDTLAQYQGNTGGTGHSNAPAGLNFRATELK